MAFSTLWTHGADPALIAEATGNEKLPGKPVTTTSTSWSLTNGPGWSKES